MSRVPFTPEEEVFTGQSVLIFLLGIHGDLSPSGEETQWRREQLPS